MNHLFQGISRINSVANHDFCPWANRYVYWLKEPVGWFLIATLASLLVGAFLSPIGWSVAAGLAAILALGLGFPWLAVRTDGRPGDDDADVHLPSVSDGVTA